VSAAGILTHFREQAAFCDLFGSPFTARLLEQMAADLEAGGPVQALVGAWPTPPRPDALSLRLAGALHFAVLSGKDAALAAHYPAAAPNWRMDAVWPLAREFLAREIEWAAQFIQSPPQTNETRRSIGLFVGFAALAQRFGLPLDTYEIGASAGLNLNWDHFAFRTDSWAWGDGDVVIDTAYSGAAPAVDAPIRVVRRAACDINPLDIRDPLKRLQLRAYIWPDQADRLARFDGAVALALARDVRVDAASADVWLAEKLQARAPDACAVIYHSVFYQYPPPAVRDAIKDAIYAAGAQATPQAPLAWLRFEPEALWDRTDIPTRFMIDMITWPGETRTILAAADPHGRMVERL
jgi:hypothetical protein